MSFLNTMLCYDFSLEAFLQDRLKVTLPKNNINASASMKTDRRENIKFIVTNYKDRFTSKITTTYLNMFSFG